MNNRNNQIKQYLLKKRFEDEQEMQQRNNSRLSKIQEFYSKGKDIGNQISSFRKTPETGTALESGASLGNAASSTGTAAVGSAGTGAATSGTMAGGSTAAGSAAGGTAGSSAGGAAAAGPLAIIAAIGSAAIQGTNRKKAQQQGQALLDLTKQQSESTAINNIANTQEQAMEDAALSGGAAPISEVNQIADYQDYLRQNGYSDDVINGVSQGLNYGNKDIANWIDQYNNGADGLKNPIRIPKTQEEIELARNGQFNSPLPITQNQQNFVQPTIEEQNSNTDVKNSILAKFARGIADFTKGFEENRDNAFSSNNLLPDDNKGKMQRTGEAFGTIARMLNKPAVQGLVSGGLTAALSNDPMAGLSTGYKFAKDRQKSNMYQNELANRGVNINPGVLGNIDEKDFANLYNSVYKDKVNEQMAQKILNDYIYRQGLLEDKAKNFDYNVYKDNRDYDYKVYNDDRNYNLDERKLREDVLYKNGILKDKQVGRQLERDKFNYSKEYDNKKLGLEGRKIAAYEKRTNKSGNSSREKILKLKETPEYKKDLAVVMKVFSNQDKASLDRVREDFINEYGIDPLKDIVYSYKNKEDDNLEEDMLNWLR